MKEPLIHELTDWRDFESALRGQLSAIEHKGRVLVRNFDRVTLNLNEYSDIVGEQVDRLQIAINTGTDRNSESQFWNAEGHDLDHDLNPSGKSADEIIYAYIVDASTTPYDVYIADEPEKIDLTEGLTDQNAILIYDATKLSRASKNEHWFNGDPRDALLMIFIISEDEAPSEPDRPDSKY
jgi:hypothetical protein